MDQRGLTQVNIHSNLGALQSILLKLKEMTTKGKAAVTPAVAFLKLQSFNDFTFMRLQHPQNLKDVVSFILTFLFLNIKPLILNGLCSEVQQTHFHC